MVDVYVVTILVALVSLGNLATFEAEAGAVFFGGVVVLTLFAAEAFVVTLSQLEAVSGTRTAGSTPGVRSGSRVQYFRCLPFGCGQCP